MKKDISLQQFKNNVSLSWLSSFYSFPNISSIEGGGQGAPLSLYRVKALLVFSHFIQSCLVVLINEIDLRAWFIIIKFIKNDQNDICFESIDLLIIQKLCR